MVNQEDATIISLDKVPPSKLVGAYTFLRDMGKVLGKNEAIQLTATDAIEARKVQNRWRSYFKGKAHSKKETTNGKITIYLWLES